jgi:ribA/ribD-fused uncharacterized protein
MIIIKPDAITDFRKDYFFLSNFYPCTFIYDDITYPSSEHAYMACKVLDKDHRRMIAALKTAREARNYGQTVVLRPNWEDIKYRYMKEVLVEKFSQNLNLKEKLLATGNRQLVEGGLWHDLWWGICNCEKHQGDGKNALGQILMEIRDSFKM